MSVFTKSSTNVKKIAVVAAFIMGSSMVLSACSKEEHHEVPAVDKVQEAQELALANAPEAEIVELPTAEVTEDAGEATATDATTDEAATQDADSSETELEKADAIEEAAALGEPAPSSATATDNTTESAN
ncbi:hypothetical protein [Psychrobacter sp. I-STPA10]|uniref:hypothetical protein n=1 Tax=Psychrobacter sp. I-STPA10 TaxID=2585769 RepID=UPI001E2FA8CA|nr:hypothetical protein [Psychrobacter sp. I-STPA10]